MENNKVLQMSFAKIYGLLLNKTLKKGRTRAEVKDAEGPLIQFTYYSETIYKLSTTFSAAVVS